MIISMSIPILDPKIQTSFTELKRKARDCDDVATWFMENLHELDPVSPETVAKIVVSLKYEKDILTLLPEPDPNAPQSLSVVLVRKEKAPLETPLFGFLKAKPYIGPAQSDTWSFGVDMTEWSFMVAMMAGRYVERQYWQENIYRTSKIITAYLEQNLPQHFPGCTPQSLRALADTGLLTDTSTQSVMDLLFNSRTAIQEVPALPADFGNCTPQ